MREKHFSKVLGGTLQTQHIYSSLKQPGNDRLYGRRRKERNAPAATRVTSGLILRRYVTKNTT